MTGMMKIFFIFTAFLGALNGFAIPTVDHRNFIRDFDKPEADILLRQWCIEANQAAREFKWGIDPCKRISWKVGGISVRGRALVYAEFGNPSAENVTLILSGVHGDELTPQFFGFMLAEWMLDHAQVKELQNARVVIAPLVNPDSFFKKPRTRVNANGVDVNRNFATSDWGDKALVAWKKKFRSNPRRFPGWRPSSEPETWFQESLIKKVKPQKLLSIHAPLNFMDYDGPTHLSLEKFPKEYVDQCIKLREQVRAVSGGFFPGSLGNFAGRELGIPTLTLELPSADAKKSHFYWRKFSQGIQTMIRFEVPNGSKLARGERFKEG